MVTVEAVNYIKNQLQKGHTRPQIEAALAAGGWKQEDIQEAFRLAESGTPVSTGAVAGGVLPGPVDLLHEAWAIYKPLMWKFLKANILSELVNIPLALAVMLVIFLMIFIPLPAPWDIIKYIIGLPVFLFIVVAMNVLYYWGEAADIELIKDSNEHIGSIEALKRSRHLLLPFFWVQFLMGLIVVVGFIFLIIPGILFLIWFTFAPYIVFTEGLGGMSALDRSREYVKGHFAAVLGRMAFIGFIGLVGYIGVQFLGQIANWGAGSFAESVASFVVTLISFVVMVLVFLLSPIIITYIFVLYKYIRALKSKSTFVFTQNSVNK